MATAQIYNLDASALFFDRPQPDRSQLVTHLNEKLAALGRPGTQISPLSQSDWWLLACDDFHVMVSFSNEQAADPKIAEAAQAATSTHNRFDYLQVVELHKAHVRVEVGDGHAPLPPEARHIMQEFGTSKSCDPDLKMRVLHWVIQFIGAHDGFLGLYFGPSDQLLNPDALAAARKQDFPLSLLLHPVASLPEPGPSGRDGYHLRLRKPALLPGPSFELEGIPVAIPHATACSLFKTLFQAARSGKVTFEHGQVFTPSQKVRLYVREALPDDANPRGRMILSFWNAMGHDAPRPVPPPPKEEPVVQSPQAAQPITTHSAEPVPEPDPPPVEKIPEILSVDPEDVHKYKNYMSAPVEETLISRISSRTMAPKTPRAPEPAVMTDTHAPTPPFTQKARSALMAMGLGFALFFVPYGDLAIQTLNAIQANETNLAAIPSASRGNVLEN